MGAGGSGKAVRREPEVLYEDNHLLVLAKPARMPVVPDASGDFALLDWGRAYLKKSRNKKGRVFLGVVHRLDRPVSGVVCFAVTSKAASRLSDLMRRHAARKTYLALTDRRPSAKGGRLEHWLVKDRKNNMVHICHAPCHSSGAKRAVTEWKYDGMEKGLHRLLLWPKTGRAHQLRVQCAAMGAPLAGDRKYGSTLFFEKGRIGLHAMRLELEHPVRHEKMTFETAPHWKLK